MASLLFCFWSFLFLFIYFENTIQGRGLPTIDGSKKNGSISCETTSEEAALVYALDSRIEAYHEGKEKSKIYNKSYDLAWEKTIVRDFNHSDIATNEVLHWAILGTYKGEYHSAKAALNVYALPQVAHNQESRVSIWVMNRGDGSPGSQNFIQAGWHVNPELYGDTDTRFFVHWAVGNTGCFNLHCKGFILDESTDLVPGRKIRPLSIYNGEQFSIFLKIWQDLQTGDWWLFFGPEGTQPVGYWPRSLFTGLQVSATHVQYGGVVRFVKNEKSPPMGSGHFPDEGRGKAASLMSIELDEEPYNPLDYWKYFFDMTQPICYKIDRVDKLYFGGPGGCLD